MTVYILTAQLIGGFTMMPLVSEGDCLAALAALPAEITQDGECHEIDMVIPSSIYAPEMAPMPIAKPGPES